MVRPTKVEKIEDILAWIQDHDGRIDAWWEAQHRTNERMESRLDGLSRRMTAVEKKIMWITGAAAAIGSFAAPIVTKLFE